MKKLIFVLLLTACCYPLISQVSGENNPGGTVTATLTSSSRLFSNHDDLTSVIIVIPRGSSVTVLDSDSTYFHVLFEEDEGFIYRRHAVLDKNSVSTSKQETNSRVAMEQQPSTRQKQTQPQPQPQPQPGRFAYLESKYGTSMAARINAGKIWKGMNAGMVKDSWGKADKISREISGNTVKEEWIYRNTWLYFENNTLVGWGAVAQ